MNENNYTFIDANILIYIYEFKKFSVDEWLENLYGTIFIHKEVMNELIISDMKEHYLDKIGKSLIWQLFDPEDEQQLTEEEYDIYQGVFEDIREKFAQFRNERSYKSTTDSGDIAILAGCLFQQVPLITSQDSDFVEFLDISDLKVSSGDEEVPDRDIEIHDLLNLGKLLLEKNICTRSQYKQFCKAVIGAKKFQSLEEHLNG